jgi:hypothetical protein
MAEECEGDLNLLDSPAKAEAAEDRAANKKPFELSELFCKLEEIYLEGGGLENVFKKKLREKSDTKAVACKDEADKKLNKDDFYGALVCYNER